MKLYGKKALLNNIENINLVRLVHNDNAIIDILKENKIKYIFVNQNYFKAFDKNLNHQYIESETVERNNETWEEFIKNSKQERMFVVILDSLQDPFNFGSIIRTCESFNVDAIVYKKDNQVQINDFVKKTSQGAINNIRMFKVVNLSNEIEFLKQNKFWIYASVINEKASSYNNIDYDKKTCLIVGNEEKGISLSLQKNADFLITIPTEGKTSSLNVSVACGIIISMIKIKQK